MWLGVGSNQRNEGEEQKDCQKEKQPGLGRPGHQLHRPGRKRFQMVQDREKSGDGSAGPRVGRKPLTGLREQDKETIYKT